MGFSLGDLGWFNSKSDSYSTSNTTNYNTDKRSVGETGDGGVIVSPDAAQNIGGGASVRASDHATVTTNIENSGVGAGDMAGLMDMIFQNSASERQATASLGQSLAAGMLSQGNQLSDIVAATKAPEQTALNSLIPVAMLGILVLFIFGRKR